MTWRSSWYWVPVAPRVAVVAYSPALVAFVGGGPGFSVSVGVGTDYIGWFPLAPRDPLIAWWGRPAVNVNVTNVTYVNRTYVTVVNQTTFVSSRIVTNNYVRDRSVVSRVERAPVVTRSDPDRADARIDPGRDAPDARGPSAGIRRVPLGRHAGRAARRSSALRRQGRRHPREPRTAGVGKRGRPHRHARKPGGRAAGARRAPGRRRVRRRDARSEDGKQPGAEARARRAESRTPARDSGATGGSCARAAGAARAAANGGAPGAGAGRRAGRSANPGTADGSPRSGGPQAASGEP